MFAGSVGLIAMSTSLSPLSASPSFDMFTSVWTRGAACAADAPKISASAANAVASTRSLISPSLFRSREGRAYLCAEWPTRGDSLSGRDALGRLEQLVPGTEVHARTPELLAGRPLELVDRRPARLHERLAFPLRKERLDRVGRDLLAV